jgi:hypothetical protein
MDGNPRLIVFLLVVTGGNSSAGEKVPCVGWSRAWAPAISDGHTRDFALHFRAMPRRIGDNGSFFDSFLTCRS